jgi:hypothetical protein
MDPQYNKINSHTCVPHCVTLRGSRGPWPEDHGPTGQGLQLPAHCHCLWHYKPGTLTWKGTTDPPSNIPFVSSTHPFPKPYQGAIEGRIPTAVFRCLLTSLACGSSVPALSPVSWAWKLNVDSGTAWRSLCWLLNFPVTLCIIWTCNLVLGT